MIPQHKWKKAQKWEQSWWGDCLNTHHEEEKQLVYAKKMGLICAPDNKTPYRFDLEGASVLDIGGGPASLLLKCFNFSEAYIVEPLLNKFPRWVKSRYSAAKILSTARKGEDIENHPDVDEVWLYNVLEHTDQPEKIITNAKKISKIIRIFEWVDTKTNEGHPHILTEDKLNEWLGGEGKVEWLEEHGCVGKAYYGIFRGNRYNG